MIPSNLDTVIGYVGTGAVATYSFPFKTFESQDIKAKTRVIATGVETDLTQGVDFSVTGVGQEGGSITLTAGNLAATHKLFIYFEPNLQQLTKFRDLGRHSTRNIENAVDRITMHVKGFFQGIGEVARSLKLPTNVHPDEFDPTLPSDFNASKEMIPAVNDTLDGWKMFDGSVIQEITDFLAVSYTPSAIQTLGAAGVIAVGKWRRQHVKIKSDGGEKALDNTPFGSNPALFRDGMEIVVESDSLADFMTLAEFAGDYGYEGNGGIEFKYKTVVSFVYNATKKRFFVKSLGAW